MNTPLIEQIGLQPLKDKLKSMGGWPVLEVTIKKVFVSDWFVNDKTLSKFKIVIDLFVVVCLRHNSRPQGNDWSESEFDWIETTYKFRKNSYSTDTLINFSIGTDIKNSSWRVIDIDQACSLNPQTVSL